LTSDMIQIVSSSTYINTFLKIGDELFNVFRVDMTTGAIRVGSAKPPNLKLTVVEDLSSFGVTADGVMARIVETMTHDEVKRIILKEIGKESKHYQAQAVLTTDNYFPALRINDKQALGVKRNGDTFEIYEAFTKKAGVYQPLITDKCYFSDAFRLMMPASMLLRHLLEHLGWIADPYDWQKFEWASTEKKWVEIPEMKRDGEDTPKA